MEGIKRDYLGNEVSEEAGRRVDQSARLPERGGRGRRMGMEVQSTVGKYFGVDLREDGRSEQITLVWAAAGACQEVVVMMDIFS